MNQQLILSLEEKDRFAQLEAIVQKGLETFMEVGAALLEIRDRKLYQESYGTFEDYCRGRWTLSAKYAHRLVSAYEVVTDLRKSPMGDFQALPKSERVARELVPLSPTDRGIVWEEALKAANGKEPTAEAVKAKAEELIKPEERPKRKRKNEIDRMLEANGLRRAFDGSVVPAECTDEERVRRLEELNKRRAAREAEYVAKHGPRLPPVGPIKLEPPKDPEKVSSSKKELSIEQRFKQLARVEFLEVFKRYFRRHEYVRVYELLGETINKSKSSPPE
jgi:hypothetical protein